MKELTDINYIKSLLSRYGFQFSKSLGQNFIIDPYICPEMVRLSGINKECGVIEVGAGVGVLTKELAEKSKKVVSIELDTKLLPLLNETLGKYENIKIINADILKTDLNELIDTEFPDMPVYVCANLPYYITSPVIMKLLTDNLSIKGITVMVQKEAADRLCAKVGSRLSGAITVAVNYYADVKKLFDVSNDCFIPSPKVDSSVINMTICKNKKHIVDNEKLFFDVVSVAFAQRRKTALNSISSGLGISKEIVLSTLEKCLKPQTVRAEEFTLEEFAMFANVLQNEMKR